MSAAVPLTPHVGPPWLRPLVDNIGQIPEAYRRRLPADVLAMVTAARAVSSVRRNSREAAVSTTMSCTPTPMIESINRIVPLRIAPRTARPSTTPATSPTTTSARIRNRAANSLARGAAMWATMCGASNTPAIAPSSTPTNDSSEPSAPERQPEMAAMKATARTATSSHCDGVIEFITGRPLRRPAPSPRPTHGDRRCPKAWPSRPRRARRRSPGR